jgi:hypothetical protein
MPRRLVLGFAALVVIVVGLTAHFVGGPAADFAGDVLYAVLVYLLLAVCFGRPRPILAASVAFGFCVAIELFQLTGLPAALWAVFPPIELVLGANFSVVDIVAYGLGVLAVASLDFAFFHYSLQPARRA